MILSFIINNINSSWQGDEIHLWMVKQNVRIVVVSVKVLKDQTEKSIALIVITKNGANIRGNKLQYITMIQVAKFVERWNDKSNE